MKVFQGRHILNFNTTIPKIDQIQKLITRYIIVNH